MADYVPTVVLDFDGVLHRYSRGWMDGEIYDGPVDGTLAALMAMKQAGYRLVVCTARGEPHDAVQAWLERHGLARYIDEVTNRKPGGVVYIDDRAVPFTGDWRAALEATDRLIQEGPWTKQQA